MATTHFPEVAKEQCLKISPLKLLLLLTQQVLLNRRQTDENLDHLNFRTKDHLDKTRFQGGI